MTTAPIPLRLPGVVGEGKGMNAAMTLPRPNTRDMLGIHQIFRDAFSLAPQLVGSVCNDHHERVEAVVSYYRNVLALLHAHHEGEDELIWPKLAGRAPDQAELIGRMQSQHEGLLAALVESERRLGEWAASPDIEHGAPLAASVATLGVLCAAHFDEEERRILPLAAEHVSVEEWAELPAHGMRAFGGDKLWLVLGLIQEQMPPEVVAEMEANMPPPVRDMWQGTGRQQFSDFITQLRA
jgi:hemerythrin-like domain-containing protein